MFVFSFVSRACGVALAHVHALIAEADSVAEGMAATFIRDLPSR